MKDGILKSCQLPWGLTSREGGNSHRTSIVKEGLLGRLINSLLGADKTGRKERREQGRGRSDWESPFCGDGDVKLIAERVLSVPEQGRQEKGRREP